MIITFHRNTGIVRILDNACVIFDYFGFCSKKQAPKLLMAVGTEITHMKGDLYGFEKNGVALVAEVHTHIKRGFGVFRNWLYYKSKEQQKTTIEE